MPGDNTRPSWEQIAASLGAAESFQSVPQVLSEFGVEIPETMTPVEYVAATAARGRFILARDRAQAAMELHATGEVTNAPGFVGLSVGDIDERGAHHAARAHAIIAATGVAREFVEDGVWRFAGAHLVGPVSDLEYQLDINGYFGDRL